MSKRQLIDGIRQFNPTAQTRFLAQFDETALQQYLTSLQSVAEKRLKLAAWMSQPTKLRMVS